MSTCLLVTTWNRTPQLRRSLERLSELTPPDEILIIDDGGDDGCEQMLREVVPRFTVPVRYLYTHNPGLAMCSHARNVGLKHTDAELLIISEPEMMFITDAVPQFLAGYERTHKVVSAGIVYHAQHESMTTPEQANRIEGWVAPYSALWPRAPLMEIGGWCEDMPGPWGYDDIDVLTRLRVLGIGQEIDRSIEVFHQWHVNPGRDQYGALANDAWWKSREYDDHPERIYLNQDRDWGAIKPR